MRLPLKRSWEDVGRQVRDDHGSLISSSGQGRITSVILCVPAVGVAVVFVVVVTDARAAEVPVVRAFSGLAILVLQVRRANFQVGRVPMIVEPNGRVFHVLFLPRFNHSLEGAPFIVDHSWNGNGQLTLFPQESVDRHFFFAQFRD